MSHRYIEEFVAVVEERSFTKAAARLETSKSRISQQVSELEDKLGVQLLHRSTRSLALTEIGARFFYQCQQGIRLLDSAALDAQAQQEQLKGKIRVNSVGGIIGESLVANAIIAFMKHYEDINVELEFGSAHANVIEDHYDAVFRMGKLKDSSLIARPLVSLRSYICASPKLLHRFPTPKTPKELEKLPWIVGSIGKSSLQKGKRTVEYEPTSCMQCKNGHVMKNAVLGGLGVARLASIYIEKEVHKGKVVELLPEWRAPTHDLAIVYPQYKYKLRRVQTFITFVLDYFSSIKTS